MNPTIEIRRHNRRKRPARTHPVGGATFEALPALRVADGLTPSAFKALYEPQQRVEIDTFFTCTAKLL